MPFFFRFSFIRLNINRTDEWYFTGRIISSTGGTWGATDHPLAHYPLRLMYHGLWDEYKQETGKDADKEFPVYEPSHQIMASNGIPAIENVGGDIDEVTGMRCTIAAFPYRFADPGHMVRVVAIVDK